MERITLTIMLLFCFSFAAEATGIKGTVTDRRSNQGVEDAMVFVTETYQTVFTDEYGNFSVDLPPGVYHIEYSAVGYHTYNQFDIEITTARKVEVEIELERKNSAMDSVVIKANEFYRSSETPTGVIGFGQRSLENMPGATMDISKYIKTLPGVSPKVAFGYNLTVRGGAPFENGYFIDGIELPQITHFSVQGASGGPNSLLNSHFLNKARLYTSNIPSEFSNATSSVLEIEAEVGATEKWAYNATIGANDFGFLAQGPTGKKSSIIISARESYTQHMLKAIGVPVIPFFSDAHLKWNYKINKNHEISLLGLFAFDRYELNLEAEPDKDLLYNVGYIPEGTQLTGVAGINYKFYTDESVNQVVLSYSTFNNKAQKYIDNDENNVQLLNYSSRDEKISLRAQSERYYNNDAKLSYGINAEYLRFPHEISRYEYHYLQDELALVDRKGALEFANIGAFLNYSSWLIPNKLDYNVSMRLDASTYSQKALNPLRHFSPRISSTYHLGKQWDMSVSAGIMHQLPPTNVLAFNEKSSSEIEYITVNQASIGLNYRSKIGYHVSVNPYYKYYANYPILQYSGISLANATADYVAIGEEPIVSDGKGRGYGVSVNVEKLMTKDFSWKVNYSLGKSEFTNIDGNYAPSSWDNTHALNIVAMYRVGKGWQFSGRWYYATGSPYSPYDRDVSRQIVVWDKMRRGVFDFENANKLRLNDFHSLDIRVDKQFNFKKWTFTAYIDLQNVYQSSLQTIPYFSAIRSGDGFVVDSMKPDSYLSELIETDSGRLLPSVGLIFDF